VAAEWLLYRIPGSQLRLVSMTSRPQQHLAAPSALLMVNQSHRRLAQLLAVTSVARLVATSVARLVTTSVAMSGLLSEPRSLVRSLVDVWDQQ
jgi:hypothetical protein